MKNFWRIVHLLIPLLIVPTIAHAQPAQKPPTSPRQESPSAAQPQPKSATPAVPAPETMLALIRTHLLALDHALRTGNFYVLHALGGPFLQSRLTPEQLSNAFAALKADRPDLAATAIATPQLTREPAIAANGMLQLVGQFPTRPREIRFEMLFEPAGGEWRLAGMNVSVLQAPLSPSSPAKK